MGLCITSIVKTLTDNHTLDDRNHQGHHTTLLLSETLLSTAQASLCVGEVRRLQSTGSPCGEFWSALGRRRRVVRVLQWFQQDGATTHSSNESLAWVQHRFPDRLISRRCDLQWSPHSPDLNSPDFYMWGYLKDRVYGNNPQTIPDLKAAIRATPREECGRVIENFARRIQMCLQRRGAHLEHSFERQWNKEFCSTDLKLWRCLLHRLDLMSLKFCVNLNKILEVIRFLVMTAFLCHPVHSAHSLKNRHIWKTNTTLDETLDRVEKD